MTMNGVLAALLLTAAAAGEEPLVDFDFTNPAVTRDWKALHDVTIGQAADGMRLDIRGGDPYLAGPARNYPADRPLIVNLRITTATGGGGQLFFFQRTTTEAESVRFSVPAGGPHDVTLFLPALKDGYRFRFDPPGQSGTCVLHRLTIRPRLNLAAPTWTLATLPTPDDAAPRCRSGRLELPHGRGLGEFQVKWNNQLVATGHNRPQLGYLIDGRPKWLPLWTPRDVSVVQDKSVVRVVARFEDADGGKWMVEQSFAPSNSAAVTVSTKTTGTVTTTTTTTASPSADATSAAIDVSVRLQCDRPRELIFFPHLLLLVGHGTNGEKKNQGLLSGLEYLADEPSSSTADVEGPAALRRVPEFGKLTMPLMTVQHDKTFVALEWKSSPSLAALFDSPDRVFGTKSSVLGLIAPGTNPNERVDGELLPEVPLRVPAGEPGLSASATILVGDGATVVDAVRSYVARHPLPPLPRHANDKTVGGARAGSDERDAKRGDGDSEQSRVESSTRSWPRPEYVDDALFGWLDSPLREAGRFRHAVGNGFQPQPAADAAWMVEWLAGLTEDAARRKTALDVSRLAWEQVAPGSEYHAMVGHLKQPVAGLVSDRTAATVEQARQYARGLLGQFDADGIARYHPPTRGLDYSRTQPSREASGLAALPVARLLQAAAYAGDEQLIEAGVEKLRKLARYDNDVPRGAQTWEIPLHTPDILASAHMVQAYTLGYELTGAAELLERAKYWAWTGVPFVYLPSETPPAGRVGPYATIAVLGATQWQAPVWMGLPVQWCGLVYAESLVPLARLDPDGPWSRLIDGIALSGMQQIYPNGHPYRGLLPDSFDPKTQSRNPADINPGTLQPLALRALTGVPAYDFRALLGRRDGAAASRWLIHAPGAIVLRLPNVARPRRVEFDVRLLPVERRVVLIHGVPPGVKVSIDGVDQPLTAPHEFQPDRGTLRLSMPVKNQVVRIALDP